jgi:hypothetical protein
LKPTPELVQALVNLRPSHDFETVVQFFLAQRETARDECETYVEGPKLWRAQGRSAFIKEFLKLDEGAATTLEKFKSKP